MKRLLVLTLLAFILPMTASADSDQPEEGESFPSYFARLTRGGAFPGIRLQAGAKFQREFFKKMNKGYWVGIRNQEMKRLTEQGVDIWFDWYRTSKPFTILGTSTRAQDPSFFEALKEKIRKTCSVENFEKEWSAMDRCEREIIAKELLFRLHDLEGQTLVDRLAKRYEIEASSIERSTDLFVEDSEGFRKRVCQMGYCGEIYFRGITGPDPQNPNRRWIVLNHELMKTMTPFERPLLQMFEYAGILSHELNHVAQDLAGIKNGLDIQVRDAESALLIEGMAEFNNQVIWREFSAASQPDSPFALFSAEQGVEIVYREGNSSSGRLFPYTIGVPFVAAFFEYRKGHTALAQRELLSVLGAQGTLTSLIAE